MQLLSNLGPCPEVSDGNPWDFTPPFQLDPELVADKTKRSKWAADSRTKWCMFNGFVGTDPSRRVQKDNPPAQMTAIVCDYDVVHTAAEIESLLQAKRFGVLPTAIELSLSGRTHVIYQLDRPINITNTKLARALLTVLRDKMGFGDHISGLDASFTDPGKYLTVSGLWAYVEPANRFPAARVEGLLVQVLQKMAEQKSKDLDPDGEQIALNLVELTAELDRRHALPPDDPQYLHNWVTRGPEKPIKLGERMVRFWDPVADDPNCVTIFEWGCYALWTRGGGPARMTWSDLLGREWVEAWKADRIGRAVNGIYYNETDSKYVMTNSREAWCSLNREQLADVLVYERMLSPRPDDEGRSEVGKARYYITTNRSVLAIGPLVYRPEGYYVDPTTHLPFLNTSKVKVLDPVDGPQTFGPTGNFPWLSKLLTLLFQSQGPTDHQLDYVLSNLAYAYRNAYNFTPQPGQVCFMAGPAGKGKTFFTNVILHHLFGGSERADRFVTGRQRFNGQLFRVGLWVIDDSEGVDYDDHRLKTRYTETIKAVAANGTMESEEKFKGSITVAWAGRLWIALNDGIKSLNRLPTTDVDGLLDKASFFKIGGVLGDPATLFSNDRDFNVRRVRQELPFFARYLLDYAIPATVLIDTRYGIKSYQAPDLLEQARYSSETAATAELLDIFIDKYFATVPDRTEWAGPAADLLIQLHKYDFGCLLKDMTHTRLGKALAGLMAAGHPQLSKHDTRTMRGWKLTKPKAPAAPAKLTTAELPL